MTDKELDSARNRVKNIKAYTGVDHIIFLVPENTYAYELGMRYGTCALNEKTAYIDDGAVFIEDIII